MRISLVIPTRERAELLSGCLDAALSVDDPDFEIVVSDNQSRDNTAEIVAARADPRLVYTKTTHRASMRANFENGLAAATGDYVIFIGDDDGVLPTGIAYLRQLLERDRPEAVAWRLLHYIWPSEVSGRPNGSIDLKHNAPFGQPKPEPAQAVLDKLFSARLRSYRHAANIYHGCISRTLIERVRANQSGTYFLGAIPDVYTSIANLRDMQGPLIWAGHPATFGGASDRSNGSNQMSAAKTSDEGKAENAAFAKEGEDDKGVAGIDISIPSVDALTLDMLDLAFEGREEQARIDWQAWLARIQKKLARMPRQKYEHGAAALAAYCDTKGLGRELEQAVGQYPFAGAEAVEARFPNQKSRLKPDRIVLADGRNLATVADAARVLDRVFGAHRLGNPFSRLKWFGALRRARSVIRQWRQEANS